MGSRIKIVLLLGSLLSITATGFEARGEPAAGGPTTQPDLTPIVVTIKDVEALGLLPADLEAFLEARGKDLSDRERDAFKTELDAFHTAWDAFNGTKSASLIKAMTELGEAQDAGDKQAIMACRGKVRRLMSDFPSSQAVYRAITAKLSTKHSVQLGQLLLDRHANRHVLVELTDAALRRTPGLAAPESNAVSNEATEQRAKLRALDQSLVSVAKWAKDGLEAREARGHEPSYESLFSRTARLAPLPAVLAVVDYRERAVGISAERISWLAVHGMNAKQYAAFQETICSLRPRRPQVISD